MSPEHEVSLVSARSIAQHLDPARYAVRPFGIARNGVWAVLGDPFARLQAGELPERGDFPFLPFEKGAEATPLPEVFFNAIHGAQGEDGQLAGYLDLLGVPLTGPGRLCLALTMDKWMTKRVWESEGLPVTPYLGLTAEAWAADREGLLARLAGLGLPLFVKPANLGSAIGVEKVKRLEDLAATLDRAFRLDRRVLVEQGLDVRELEVAVLGGDEPLVSPVGEVLVAGEFYDFADKYVDGKSRTALPADIPAELSERIRAMASRAWRAVDGHGLSRIDFFLDRRTGGLTLNEINTIPGFTSISMYPQLMAAAGLPYGKLLDRVVDLALAREAARRARQLDFTSGSDWYKA
jgi:D-alanine-D-alanine ligase